MFSGYLPERPRNRRYNKQQVCLNGHIVTNYGTTSPEDLKKFCSECGEATLMACPKCQSALRGEEIDPEVVVVGFVAPPPAYCPECGTAFPWTKRKLDAVMELAELVESDAVELEKLKQSIGDLATETPRTPVAVARMKKLLVKGGKMIGPSLAKILTDIASEAVQKQLGLK